MSDRVIIVKDGKSYEVKGDSVKGFRDATGSLIQGSPEKIRGDSVKGFRDATGSLIQLREKK